MARAILADFDPFYDHVRNGTLCFPRCEECHRFHWYPMKLCPHCRSNRIGWARVEGPARLFSWTQVQHGFDPEFTKEPGYVVALVEFEDAPGVRYVTNIIGTTPDVLRIDMKLTPVFPTGGAAAQPVYFTAVDLTPESGGTCP